MTLFIKAEVLFDSVKGEFVSEPTVIVEGDRIKEVRFHFDEEPPFGVEMVHLQGCTILPGLVDAHDHLSLSPQLENHTALMNDPDPLLMLRGITNMKTDLLKGITTSRCLGDKNFIDLYLKQAVEEGIVEGPRIVTCTRGIKTTHAHGAVGTAFDGVDAIRAAVRENLRRGADFIKFFVTDTIRTGEYLPYYMTPEEIRVFVEEAHMAGKPTSVHAIGGDGLTHCLELGVDVIEHAYFASDEQIEQFLKLNRWVVLTPSIFFNNNRWKTVPQKVAEGFYRNREEVRERHKAMIEAGIRYALGTDATHGELDEDILFLVSLGESLPKALQAATLYGAQVSGLDHLVGSVEAGKKADLVAVRGNLEQNAQAIKDLWWVMKDGKTKVREGQPLI